MLIRFLFTLAVSLTLSIGSNAFAKEPSWGIGLILGSPTALSAKHYMANSKAVDMGLAYNIHDYFLLYGDYLHHFRGVFKTEEKFVNDLTPYVGVGPVLVFDTGNGDYHRRHDRDYFDDEHGDVALGVRIPLGIEWISDQIPLGVSLEIAPGIVVLPATDAFIQGGVAARYYF